LGLANDKTNSDYNLAKAKLKYIKIKNPDRKTYGEKIINSINNETLLSEEINGDTDLDKPGDKAVLQGIMKDTSGDKISTTKREYIRMLKASGKIDKTIGDKTSEGVVIVGQEARKFGEATVKTASAVGTATATGASAVGTAIATGAREFNNAIVEGVREVDKQVIPFANSVNDTGENLGKGINQVGEKTLEIARDANEAIVKGVRKVDEQVIPAVNSIINR
jgi:hypothetical protein